jgi:hypothetical protein
MERNEKIKIKLSYPHTNDPAFQKKIALKKEFQFKYDGEIKDILKEDQEGKLCGYSQFTLSPHQQFVKRFLNERTHYNGLLLYHGMGSGKTCSAIGITEEYRYSNQNKGYTKKIIVVASPNVQENFQLQLFNEDKLSKVNGVWKLDGCVGEGFMNELKHLRLNELSKEQVVKKIQKIIKQNYIFVGYEKFANHLERLLDVDIDNSKRKVKRIKRILNKVYKGSMIVIDEVHNIRYSGDGENKKVANAMFNIVKYVDHCKLLFLSGTPMYNDPKEIVFLMNLLRINDGLQPVFTRDIFDLEGNLLVNKNGEQIGRTKLVEACNGYISFVRGENPYNFPFKVYPNDYKSPQSLFSQKYPRYQFNRKAIQEPLKHLDVYLNSLSVEQTKGYRNIIEKMYSNMTETQIETFEKQDTFGYTNLQEPLNALNIVYKSSDGRNNAGEASYLTGKEGLRNTMTYQEIRSENKIYDFDYMNEDEKMFKYENIGKYSAKIKTILEHIQQSDGIILVYSQYIDAGLVPLALALEEMGFTRLTHNSLLKKRPDIPKTTMKYAMITGDMYYSSRNLNSKELRILNSANNVNGEKCKVVLISQAGSEGLDFKNLRQVHIMEPWYNLNRIEQIIGRAIRNCSHKSLPLQKRNCQIFLHASVLNEPDSERPSEEPVDLMMYRYAHNKSYKIGKVQRVLKSISVDCLLNIEQNNFAKYMDQKIDIVLSTGETIKYGVQDKSHSSICDFQETCEYTCETNLGSNEVLGSDSSTFKYDHLRNDLLLRRVKELFLNGHVYKIDEIYDLLLSNDVTKEEIDFAIYYIVEYNDIVVDKYGRKGKLLMIKDIVIFRPEQLDKEYSTLHDYKNPYTFSVPNLKKYVSDLKEVTSNDNENTSGSVHDKTKNNTHKMSIQSARENKVNGTQTNLNMNKSINISQSNISHQGEKVYERFANKYENGMQIKDKNSYDKDDYLETFLPIIIHVNTIIPKLNGTDGDAKKILVSHIFETLSLNDELSLVSYILSRHSEKETEKLTKLERLILQHINQYSFKHNDITLYLTINLMKYKEKEDNLLKYVVHEDNDFKLTRATQIDMQTFGGMSILRDIFADRLRSNKKHPYATFLAYSAKSKTFDIRVKDNSKKRQSYGALFEQKMPGKMMEVLNEIVKDKIFIPSKKKNGVQGKNNKFTKNEWCIILEIITKLYERIGGSSSMFLHKVDVEMMKQL